MNVVFVTGAGISVPSGIPAYRNNGSGWDNKRLEKISQYNCYGNHLDELWVFWEKLFRDCVDAVPNDAHRALNTLNCTVLTQNIDSLHHRGGVYAVELHGSIYDSKCLRCKKVSETFEVLQGSRRECPNCQSDRVRPDVTMFGEPLKRVAKDALKDAEKADTLVFVGTSGNVWPVAGLPEKVQQNGGRAVLLNAEKWGSFDEVVLGDVEDIVPEYVERISNG